MSKDQPPLSSERQINASAERNPISPDVKVPERTPKVPMVVKVQLPLAPAAGDAPALIYNEDKSVTLAHPVTRTLLARFGPSEKKAYFHAVVSGHAIELGDRAKDQTW